MTTTTQLTREEFIEQYVHQSRERYPDAVIDPQGFIYSGGSIRRDAVPCDCGDPSCYGWIMISTPIRQAV